MQRGAECSRIERGDFFFALDPSGSLRRKFKSVDVFA